MPENGGGTEATSRVADVLLLFVDGPSTQGVSRIARELGISKAVVHRILTSLVSRGMVAVDPATREYRLGPAAAAIGARALRESDLRLAALPLLRELRDETRETATLSTPVPRGRVYLDQVVGLHEIKMTVELGRRFPLHAGSSGKCMLAFLDPEVRERILEGPLESLPPTPVGGPARLRAARARVARRGYAASAGERQADAGSVAAPVFGVPGPTGSVLGAISVCGPRYRVTEEFVATIAPRVVAVADRISARLGAAPRRLEKVLR